MPLTKDIERPLGQSLPKAKPPRRAAVGRGQVAGAAAVLVLLGVSSLIAFGPRPFRTPPEAVVVAPVAVDVTPQAAPEPAQTVAAAPQVEKIPDGPSIIHVAPPDETTGGIVVVGDPSAVTQNARIAHLPDRALIETSASGPLPVRAADGRRPFDVYARPWSHARGARVAIVVGGLGVSQTGTQMAIAKLPPEVTLAFATQGNSLGRWMQEARREGHEIVLQLPLEPFDYPNVNPGRNTLTVSASPEENLDNLHWALSRITNYTGVMNYMGARFTSDRAAMSPLMAELGRRGLLYLDDGSSARSLAPELAPPNKVPVAVADTVVDAQRDRGAIMKKLDELERTARAKGYAVGTASAFDVTVDAVSAWVAEAKKRGIEIVPISAIAVDPERG